jgi:hypothetical protein
MTMVGGGHSEEGCLLHPGIAMNIALQFTKVK